MRGSHFQKLPVNEQLASTTLATEPFQFQGLAHLHQKDLGKLNVEKHTSLSLLGTKKKKKKSPSLSYTTFKIN